ncbi:sugar ABC transporter permease [Aurantimonas sp. E1-2-R+4]|uniref:carbohydrate ABC transporter permease n=1 Tax=Aurantimonas sp. E1-2-R+4 TaxID=3113714 RepID=UPI002F94848D
MTPSPDLVRRTVISDHPLPWLLPLIALLVVFTIFPLIYNIWLSFHEFVPRRRVLEYVGGQNWVQLWEDSRFWQSLGVTFLYFIIALVFELALGMGIALLLDSDEPGFGILRGLLTMALVVPPAIVGMMFLLMEDSQFGVLTFFLQMIGVLSPETPILSTPSLALAGVLLAEIWQWTPFMVLILLAGLRALPTEPYEAAMIDGASPIQTFVRLTLPMMSKVIAIAVLIRGIDLFRVFDYVFVMTSGGPGTATYTLSLYAWQQTFSFIKWGYGATLSLVTLAIILVLANLFIKLAKVKW